MTEGMKWMIVITFCVIAFCGAVGALAAWGSSGANKPTADCGTTGVRDTYHTDSIPLVVVCNDGKVYEP